MKFHPEMGKLPEHFASDPNPDIVIAGIGDYPSKEALAAIDIARKEMPGVKIRFVNVSSLTSRGFGVEKRWLDEEEFLNQFTAFRQPQYRPIHSLSFRGKLPTKWLLRQANTLRHRIG